MQGLLLIKNRCYNKSLRSINNLFKDQYNTKILDADFEQELPTFLGKNPCLFIGK